MAPTVKDQEAKRLRIADLLRAQVPQQKICEIVGVSPSTVLRTKKKLEAGDDLKHKDHGPSKLRKQLTLEVLEDMKSKFKSDLCERDGKIEKCVSSYYFQRTKTTWHGL